MKSLRSGRNRPASQSLPTQPGRRAGPVYASRAGSPRRNGRGLPRVRSTSRSARRAEGPTRTRRAPAPQRRSLRARAGSDSSLCHPGIVALYDAGKAVVAGEPAFYIAMELVEGPSLATVLTRGRLPLQRSLELAAGIAEALAAVVGFFDVAHRDLKPSNIFVAEDGEARRRSWTSARQAIHGRGSRGSQAHADRHRRGGGPAGYMSPERARREPVVCESGISSFGCILYEMLTGRRAFEERIRSRRRRSSVLRDEPLQIRSDRARSAGAAAVDRRALPGEEAGAAVSLDLDLARDLRTLRGQLRGVAGRTPCAATPSVSAESQRQPSPVPSPPAPWAPRWPGPRSANGAPALEFRPLTFRSGSVPRALFTPGSNVNPDGTPWDGEPLRMYQTMVESQGLDRSR